MQEESLEKEKASKLAFLLRENKELQSELSLLMQQQLGTQFACFTGTKVQILTPEAQRSTEKRSNVAQFTLLYWYKSTNTDT